MTNNEKLNTALYEKMFAEQEKYRDWLLSQPPEEILNHCYEYTVREDILMTLEWNDLTGAQANALLLAQSPMGEIFTLFENTERNYMDGIRDITERRANELSQKWRDLPVYAQPASYAREHDELPNFRLSNKLNVSCKEAIEASIGENYADNCLNSKAVYSQIEGQFGAERMKYVLAVTVRQKDWDGRISDANKAWAKTVPIVENNDAFGSDRNSSFVVDKAHPGLVDMLVTYTRKQFALENAEPEKKPSVLTKLQQAQPSKATPVSKGKDMEL